MLMLAPSGRDACRAVECFVLLFISAHKAIEGTRKSRVYDSKNHITKSAI